MLTVELQQVCKSYDRVVAVDSLSFTIPPGTIFGLLGPNGAGKTSTIRMMIGITMPDAGVVRLFGEPFTRKHLQRVGYLPEERGLYKKMRVLEHLVLLGRLHGLSAAEAARRARHWCERLEIAEKLQKKVEELSKGMQQKIQFIAALMHDPDFIIMKDRKSTRLNSSHRTISYAVFCLKKKKKKTIAPLLVYSKSTQSCRYIVT